MKRFYEGIEQKKEIEQWQDTQNRKHHDTLLPGQKSPIPLDRYDDFSTKQIESAQSSLNRNTQYKMIARALYNFQVSGGSIMLCITYCTNYSTKLYIFIISKYQDHIGVCAEFQLSMCQYA